MISQCIRYTLDRHKLAHFVTYSRWIEGGIIRRCGGEPLGYFLPKKGYGGSDNVAMTLIVFDSLAAFEFYREKLIEDPDTLSPARLPIPPRRQLIYYALRK